MKPVSTYRLQLNKSFNFKSVEKVIDYLSDLGISHIYFSPITKAVSNSSHGYNVADPSQLNPEIGTLEQLQSISDTLKQKSMGIIADIVPNHMAFSDENPYLCDVLEKGQSSKYAEVFDINWNHHLFNGKVSAPFLPQPYEKSIESVIKLVFNENGLFVDCGEVKLPIRIEDYGVVFSVSTKHISDEIIKSIEGIKSGKVSKNSLWKLYQENTSVKSIIDESIKFFNENREKSLILLNTILSKQHYKLAFWKASSREVNYRRFFDVNGLISVRIENETAFDLTHSLIFKLTEKGIVDGIRVDHVDGLYDPKRYLEKLKERVGNIYIVVEKILAFDEELPDWNINGTTGYEFLNYLNELFCRSENEDRLTQIYQNFTNITSSPDKMLYESKKLILENFMAGDVENITMELKKLADECISGKDLTFYELKEAVVELVSNFKVYRTYISRESPGENDFKLVKEAVKKSTENRKDIKRALEFIKKVFTFEEKECVDNLKDRVLKVIMKFQQFTGPATAKGFEDTFLYRYNRLISLNEVGSEPERFGISIDEFHDFIAKRKSRFPYSMNATSTHDTKRGEDVRARINVLSEIPDEWELALNEWSKINEKHRVNLGSKTVPSKNEEYFIYQTLLGSYPFGKHDDTYVERIKNYLSKALKEAKENSNWLYPDGEYEKAVQRFAENILNNQDFLESFRKFQNKVARYGVLNSLTQTTLKIMTAGVPDFYQGTELWDLNLVDPDNRRPVDFELRKKILEEVKNSDPVELLKDYQSGKVKMYLIYRLLNFRRNNPDIFSGEYVKLKVEGSFSESVVSFALKNEGKITVVIVPRFFASTPKTDWFTSGSDWKDTRIPVPFKGSFKDLITNRQIEISGEVYLKDVIVDFPVSVMVFTG